MTASILNYIHTFSLTSLAGPRFVFETPFPLWECIYRLETEFKSGETRREDSDRATGQIFGHRFYFVMNKYAKWSGITCYGVLDSTDHGTRVRARIGLGLGVESAHQQRRVGSDITLSPFILFPLLLIFGLPKINACPVELSFSQFLWRFAMSVPLYCITFYAIGLAVKPFLKPACNISSTYLRHVLGSPIADEGVILK